MQFVCMGRTRLDAALKDVQTMECQDLQILHHIPLGIKGLLYFDDTGHPICVLGFYFVVLDARALLLDHSSLFLVISSVISSVISASSY